MMVGMEPIGLSVSAAARLYGLDRQTLARAILAGELPASRPGARRILLLRPDIEAWLRRHAVQPSRATDVVERVLERERRQGAGT